MRAKSLINGKFNEAGLIASEKVSMNRRFKMEYVHKNLSTDDMKASLASLFEVENLDASARLTRKKMTSTEYIVFLYVMYSFPIWKINKPMVPTKVF